MSNRIPSFLFATVALVVFAAVPQAGARGLEDALGTIETLATEAGNAEDRLDKVLEVYRQTRQAGNQQEAEEVEEQVEDARQDVRQARQRLDEARYTALAEEAGVSPNKVRALRESGMGWGRVARELGVHPSLLGKGSAFKDKAAKRGGKGKGMQDRDGMDDADDVPGDIEDEDDVTQSPGAKGKGRKNKDKSNKGRNKKQ